MYYDFFSRSSTFFLAKHAGEQSAQRGCAQRNWFEIAAAFTKRGWYRNEPLSAFRPSPSALARGNADDTDGADAL
jgi:hypothetical protein